MIVLIFLGNLAATIIIEGTLIALLFRRRDFVYYSFLCNLLTNPAVNLLLALVTTYLGTEFYYPALILLEVSAVLIEAYVYRTLCGFKTIKALCVSALANTISFGAGFLFYSLTGITGITF